MSGSSAPQIEADSKVMIDAGRQVVLKLAQTDICRQRTRARVHQCAAAGLVPVGSRRDHVVFDPAADTDGDGIPATKTVPCPGARTHYGLIAQEVKAALDAAGAGDFGGYIKTDASDPESEEGLRYDQFVAPLIRAVQELTVRVNALEQKA
jgi:hypothetical protein